VEDATIRARVCPLRQSPELGGARPRIIKGLGQRAGKLPVIERHDQAVPPAEDIGSPPLMLYPRPRPISSNRLNIHNEGAQRGTQRRAGSHERRQGEILAIGEDKYTPAVVFQQRLFHPA